MHVAAWHHASHQAPHVRARPQTTHANDRAIRVSRSQPLLTALSQPSQTSLPDIVALPTDHSKDVLHLFLLGGHAGRLTASAPAGDELRLAVGQYMYGRFPPPAMKVRNLRVSRLDEASYLIWSCSMPAHAYTCGRSPRTLRGRGSGKGRTWDRYMYLSIYRKSGRGNCDTQRWGC